MAPDELDLGFFERRAEAAGSALATGDADLAVRLYREALAVWRGEPLADLLFEPFARLVVERLSEVRWRSRSNAWRPSSSSAAARSSSPSSSSS